MYQTEVMIYLHANRLYHVLPLVSTGNFRERSWKFMNKWVVFFFKNYFLASPRRLRAKYTLRTNLRFVLWVFRPCRELLLPKGRCVRNRTPKCPLTYIILPPLSLSNIYERRKHYRTKFIYSDKQAPQCPWQDYLYIQSRQAGEFICGLWNHRPPLLDGACTI